MIALASRQRLVTLAQQRARWSWPTNSSGSRRRVWTPALVRQTRRQFGTIIGTFQAIKHLIADLYTQLEAARSAAVFAAWCADQEPERLLYRDSAHLAGDAASNVPGKTSRSTVGSALPGSTQRTSTSARPVEPAPARLLARSPIKRRACSSSKEAADGSALQRRGAGASGSGTFRANNSAVGSLRCAARRPGDEEELFDERLERERFLAAKAELPEAGPLRRATPLMQEVIFFEEYVLQAPGRLGHIGEGLLGPTLIALGTEEQRAVLPKIASAEEFWCQGY